MISYSDATVPSSKHAVKGLIRFFRIPSAGFWSWFCKLALFNTVISGQNFLVLPSTQNQTGPMFHEFKFGVDYGDITRY